MKLPFLQREPRRRALLVVTGHDRVGSTARRTGLWLSDVTRAYRALQAAGYDCDLLSPRGGRAPVDERSFDLRDPDNQAFLENGHTASALGATLSPRGVLPGEYRVVFFAGGHGALTDLRADGETASVAIDVYNRGGVLAANGHGVAALLALAEKDGAILRGREVTAFSAAEETLMLMRAHVPYLLETELREAGALYTSSDPFTPHVRSSGRVVTGQNPQSCVAVAEAVLAADTLG